MNHQQSGGFRLLQVTDCHLGGQPNEELLGMNTDDSFHDVMSLLKEQQANPDLVVVSGDIASKGQENAYYRFLDLMPNYITSAPLAWLPGNHDHAGKMKAIEEGEGKGKVIGGVTQTPHWQIVLLDSSVLGSEGGAIKQAELDRLDHLLKSSTKHNMVFVHHQPVPVGTKWLDTYVIDNSDELFAVLDRYNHVKAVVFGHVHQQFEVERNGVQLLSTPSTCIQFLPNQVDFGLDTVMPGYRWFDLFEDGSIKTSVERVSEKDYGVDYESGGY